MSDTSHGWLVLRGASGNNLRRIDVAIPRGLFTCVTGVSGSGKSTLVQDTLFPRLMYEVYGTRTTWAPARRTDEFGDELTYNAGSGCHKASGEGRMGPGSNSGQPPAVRSRDEGGHGDGQRQSQRRRAPENFEKHLETGRTGTGMTQYAVVFEKGKRNWSAYVPDLPGCVATGKTRKETETMIREAIEFHLEGMRLRKMPIPPSVSTAANVRVSA